MTRPQALNLLVGWLGADRSVYITTNQKSPQKESCHPGQMSGPPATHWLVGRPFCPQPSIHPPSSTCPKLLSSPFFFSRHHLHIFKKITRRLFLEAPASLETIKVSQSFSESVSRIFREFSKFHKAIKMDQYNHDRGPL